MEHPFCQIEDVSDGVVSGWAWDPRQPNRQLHVKITHANGDSVVTLADIFREELEVQDIGSGSHGFRARLPNHAAQDNDQAHFSAEVVWPQHGAAPAAPAGGRLGLARRFLSSLREEGVRVALRKAGGYAAKRFAGARSVPAGPTEFRPEPETGAPEAEIISVDGGRIVVRLNRDEPECSLVVFAGDRPALQMPRKNEPGADGLAANEHEFTVTGHSARDEITLWTIVENKARLCDSHVAAKAVFETDPLHQIFRAAGTARKDGAVGITCWDGAHNPIGRAKVLYDVLAGRRPVVLFSYLFPEFGGNIWRPLASANETIVTIPWSERYFYQHVMRCMGLEFDTVWMCKPRAPTFQLAANICAPDARLIADLDDNEEHFSRSLGSRTKAFGLPSIQLSRLVMENVTARTAASATLARDFDAVLLRHARPDHAAEDEAVPAAGAGGETDGVVRVGFVGTVRAHKGILQAARRIRAINRSAGGRFEFHVYGDIKPLQLCDDLTGEGVIIKQNVPLEMLPEHLREMDIVLSGYPSGAEGDVEITKYQISAKIGDALAAGKPALVPEGPSVADLAQVPGVFLFAEDTFAEQLRNAREASRKGGIGLPESFTLDAAFDSFKEAERIAEGGARASDALAFVPTTDLSRPREASQQPTLLLLWKQQDGALYGRRIDQVCRAYRQTYPDHRVVVLEILYPEVTRRLEQNGGELSEVTHLRELNNRKQFGSWTSRDGTEYRVLPVKGPGELRATLTKFLASCEMLPNNTVVVTFPIFRNLDRVLDLLCHYPLITDVVDNQLAWAPEQLTQRIMAQYFTLARVSDRVIFNSVSNYEFFRENNLLNPEDEKASIIQNWYKLPPGLAGSGTAPTGAEKGAAFDVVYSGNMNDRIDWDLMRAIVGLSDELRLHLIGEARRSMDELTALLAHDNVIFHGPQTEETTIRLLSLADLTVMPHAVDHVSTYMNPLKVHMYKALNLETIATDMPGITPDDHLHVFDTAEAFLEAVRDRMENRRPKPALARLKHAMEGLPENATAYVHMIDAVRAGKRL